MRRQTQSTFAKLWGGTGQATYLDRAARAFDIFGRCRANVAGDDLTVGKVAYETAIMYRLTGQDRYLTVCRECADNLIRSQQPEGYWTYAPRGDHKEVARTALLDFCAELTTWSVEIIRELSAAG